MNWGDIKKLSWDQIRQEYGKLRRNNFEAQTDRAVFLKKLNTSQIWTLRERYGSEAAYEKFSRLSWRQIVEDQMQENLIEVDNTILILDTFGEANFRQYGRDNLSRVIHRLGTGDSSASVREKVLQEITYASAGYPAKRVVGTTSVMRILDRVSERPRKGPKQNPHVVVTRLKAQVEKLRLENTELTSELAFVKSIANACAHCRAKVSSR